MSKQIPQGIEVLVLKAAVDPDFKQILLKQRTVAAAAIGLELTAAEAMMLAAVPDSQLEAVIARASVPQEHRRAFLGQAAAAMLAALGASTTTPAMADFVFAITASAPPPQDKTLAGRVVTIISKRQVAGSKEFKLDDMLVKDLGMKPADLVELRKDFDKEFGLKISDEAFKKVGTVGETINCVEKALNERVIGIISKRTGVEAKRIKRSDTLVKDLGAKPADLAELRTDLENAFDLKKIPEYDFKEIGSVGNVVDYVAKAIVAKSLPPEPPEPQILLSRGIQPDRPPFKGIQPDRPPFAPAGVRPQ